MTENEQPDAPSAESSASDKPDAATLKKAMKAFRKRIKLTRLDDESRLGQRAMTSGRKSQIVAIMAPYGYPKEVWDELVTQGKLKDGGGGFYELVE